MGGQKDMEDPVVKPVECFGIGNDIPDSFLSEVFQKYGKDTFSRFYQYCKYDKAKKAMLKGLLCWKYINDESPQIKRTKGRKQMDKDMFKL